MILCCDHSVSEFDYTGYKKPAFEETSQLRYLFTELPIHSCYITEISLPLIKTVYFKLQFIQIELKQFAAEKLIKDW